MKEIPNPLKVTVTLELEIDSEEWTRQFPEEDTAAIITAEVSAQVNTMVRDHYFDMGWTAKR